jgi:hypothetical protein
LNGLWEPDNPPLFLLLQAHKLSILMHTRPDPGIFSGDIRITQDVIDFINQRKSDFRISTSCGGPILLPVSLKPPKPTDLQVPAGNYVVFVSLHQARYLSTVHMGLVPFFLDEVCE